MALWEILETLTDFSFRKTDVFLFLEVAKFKTGDIEARKNELSLSVMPLQTLAKLVT